MKMNILLETKMQEKDDAILVLSDQVMQLINEVDLLKQKINK